MQCSVHKREKQRIEKCSNWTSHRPGVMAGGQQSAEPQTLECEADLSWDNELITAAMKCCLSPAHAPLKQ